jgi:hypothetical protein
VETTAEFTSLSFLQSCVVIWSTHVGGEFDNFLDKGNILISIDTNYTQPQQQHNILMVVQMYTAKKEKKN